MNVFFRIAYFSSLLIVALFVIVNTQALFRGGAADADSIGKFISVIGSVGFISSIFFRQRARYTIAIFSILTILIVEIVVNILFLLDYYCISDACISYDEFTFPFTLLSDFALIAFLSINMFFATRGLKGLRNSDGVE